MPRRRLVGVVVAVVVLAGCGISAEPEAHEIDPAEVPFGLLDDRATTTVANWAEPVTVHLVANERLVAVERTIPSDGGLPQLLDQVVDGPTEIEQELGITTAIPAGTIAEVRQSRGSAVVDLTAEFGDIRTADQPLALAQIVYTLTGEPGIGDVRFTLEGQEVDVPLPDGTSTPELTRDDLEQVAPS